MALIPPKLTPQQEQAYRQQHQAASQGYGADLARLNFDTAGRTQQYQQSLANLQRTLKQGRQSINTGFNRRGMLRSGMFRRSINENAQNQLAQLAQLQLGQQQNLGNVGIGRQQLAAQLAQQQAAINAQRYAQLAQLVHSAQIPGA